MLFADVTAPKATDYGDNIVLVHVTCNAQTLQGGIRREFMPCHFNLHLS